MEKKESAHPVEKGKRYQGYDVGKVMEQNEHRKKGWFWKVLLISLFLSAVIIVSVCGIAFQKKREQTDYLAKINQSNTLELLLDNHSNVTITQSYTGLKEEGDYKAIRFLKEGEKGELYSYLKTEGLSEDYKEVLVDKNLYHYDGSFTYFYGLVAQDYDTLIENINKEVIQLEGSEKVEEQTESSDRIKVTVNYEIQPGDNYTKMYGLKSGTVVNKTLTIDKKTMIITSDVETVNEEEIYSYTVTFDGENKEPEFYRTAKGKKTKRTCTVYYDYEGDDEEKVTYEVPVDCYFTLLDHDGYKVYMNEDCTNEFNSSQMQLQNPYNDLTLYMKKG